LNVLGRAGGINVQGEEIQKLDELSNGLIKQVLSYSTIIGGMASEEEEQFLINDQYPSGKYVVLFDPLDGSSNIDANVSVGTIFGIYRRISGDSLTEQDFLQPGSRLVAAGYAIYGSATMLVYSAGAGVHGFTLDPEYGEYLLSHPNMKIPDTCKCYSVNERNTRRWPEPTKRFVNHIKYADDPRYTNTTARYIGSAVADFHRNLLYGGVFLYPQCSKNVDGKLRLIYECNPLAFLAEQAGGSSSTGTHRVLDLEPTSIHQRIPFCVGGTQEVALYEQYWRENAEPEEAS
jgi:fructose-1,6-bisphosphatase I